MITKIKLLLKTARIGLLTLSISILIAITLRIFFIEIFQIPSLSMKPLLLPGDIILVSKINYGARLLKPLKYFKHKNREYVRTLGWSAPKEGDIFVFNWPDYNNSIDSRSTIFGEPLVKRFCGLPGSTVLLKGNNKKNESLWNVKSDDSQGKNDLFPYDSIINWSLSNYGPLYVPAKGQTIEMTKKNVCWYKDILLFENPDSQIKDNSFIIGDKTVLHYSFQHNYYFAIGDNFYNSQDSRYWGFIPDINIIGKVVMVVFSIDPNGNGLKKIRFNRFLKTFKNLSYEKII